jgi:large subunit ribosomal protein L10
MPQTKAQKQKILEELKEKIEKQKSIAFVDFTGMKVKDIFGLRKKLETVGGELKVAKKTLMGIVFKEKGIDFDFKKIKTEIALVFSYKDEILPLKIAYQTSQENRNLKILGGVLENKFIEAEKIIELAQLPSRNELLAKLVWSINAPISKFVYSLKYNLKGLLTVLTKVKT